MDYLELERYMVRARRMRNEYVARLMYDSAVTTLRLIRRIWYAGMQALLSARQSRRAHGHGRDSVQA